MKKKKNLMMVIIALVLAFAVAGCGIMETEAIDTSITAAWNGEVENGGTESTATPAPEATVAPTPEPTVIPEPTATPEPEVTYTENEYVVMIDKVDHGMALEENKINGNEMNMRMSNRHFKTTKEVDVYYWDGLLAGYVKPDVQIAIEKEDEMWYGVTIGDLMYCIKKDELDASISSIEVASNNTNTSVGVNNDNNNQNTEYQPNGGGQSSEIETPQVEVQVTPEPVVIPEPEVTPEPVVIPEPEPEPSATYSEEEVIAIVENALRAAGFVKPEEIYPAEIIEIVGPDNGMGWGIETVPMDDPYITAGKIVEGCVYQGWNMYYIEYQGVSNGRVSLKLYTGTHKY